MGDDGPGGDQGAQNEQLASNDRFERLNEVIRVHSRIDSAEPPARREPLEPTGFILITGEPQRQSQISAYLKSGRLFLSQFYT
jgi:hypothetical protein